MQRLLLLAAVLAGPVHSGLPPSLKAPSDIRFQLVSKSPPMMELRPGDILELVCEASGSPAPTIHWFRNDAPVYEHKQESNEVIDPNPTSLGYVNSSLLVTSSGSEDRYTCVASSGASVASATTIVYNYGLPPLFSERQRLLPLEPRIVLSYLSIFDIIGSTLTLPCKAKGHPRPKITWYDEQGNVIGKGNGYKVLRSGELVIHALRWPVDLGDFRCRAVNRHGEASATTFVYPAREVGLGASRRLLNILNMDVPDSA